MGLDKISRSSGSTETERYLASLAERSFLNLWSYSNPYRDQGNSQQGDGKELCDLLVVCGNDIIIFSDKSVQFGDSDDLSLDWKRWFKKAVLHSAKQLNGAERWITKHPDRIFVDKACSQPFPLKIPDAAAVCFHLVVVASGSKKRCVQYFDSGSGSLPLISDVKGESAHTDEHHLPFSVGDIQPDKRFVHILDEVTLDILLKELDTISDFLNYIRKKEIFMRSGTSLCANGEEDLLAYYLQNTIKGLPGFTSPERVETGPSGAVILSEAFWDELKNDQQFVLKKELDKESYFWDRLITKFTKNMLDGTSVLGDDDITFTDLELSVRVMAQEDRFKRRMIATSILDAIRDAEEERRSFRMLIWDAGEIDGGTAYAFLQLPHPNKKLGKTYEDYRNTRRLLLYAYCVNIKLQWPTLRYVVGIATEPPKFYKMLSEDLYILQVESLTEEMSEDAKRLAKEFDIMQQTTLIGHKVDVHEYPLSEGEARKIEPIEGVNKIE